MRRRCSCESTPRSRLFPPPKDAQGKPRHDKGRAETSRLTLLGRVSLRRRRYYDRAGGSEAPVDVLVDQTQQLISLGVAEVACRLAIDSASFERAAKNLLRAAGLSISEERLRQLVEHEGKLVLEAQGSEQLELDFSAADCKTSQRPDGEETTRVYLGLDGVMVPVITQAEKDKRRAKAREKRKHLPRRRGVHRPPLPPARKGTDERYKESKIATLYDQERRHRYVRATFKDRATAGKLLARGARELRLRGAAEKVAVSDGADWIWNQIDRCVPYVDAKVLDFYHLSEHVHAARRLVFGEENAAGNAWAEQALHAVRHKGYESFWSMLSQKRSEVGRGKVKRKAMDGLMHYVAERRELLDYGRCEKMGWDVGSGSTESMCGVMTRRLKMRGMRWDRDNAEAMMALETLEQMDGWSAWLKWRAASTN
jgi:Uncharacterised protein family (UPF0236)